MTVRPGQKPPVTLSDVARKAGVSKSTASRALANSPRLRPLTVKRVQRIAEQLNYVSHGIARALATRRTRTIGAVIPTLDNALYAISTHSLEQRLQRDSYVLLVACHEFNLDTEYGLIQAFIGRGIDALVLVGIEHSKKTFDLLDQTRIPYVLTWNYDPRLRRPCVGFDNREAGRMAADYLLRIGHKHFGVIAGILRGNDRATARLQGIKEALAAHGVKVPSGCIVERPYSIEGGREGLSMLLQRTPRPTAVLCGNDVLAIGAVKEARERHLRVPQELSITGFDDMPIAAVMEPGITTVHFPMVEVGHNAALHILRALGVESEEPIYDLPLRLVTRASTSTPGLAQKPDLAVHSTTGEASLKGDGPARRRRS